MRVVNKLKRNELYSILHYTGYICILLALVMLVPLIVALIYGEYKYMMPFVYSSIISMVFGVFLFKRFDNKKEISLKSAMVFVTVIWLIGSAIAALPYYFSGDLSYLDSYFEAMSGFTTTGFSMYNLRLCLIHHELLACIHTVAWWNWYNCHGTYHFIISHL